VQKDALVETHNSQKQQQQWQPHKQPSASQSINQILNQSTASSFSKSFIYNDKQGGGATVLGEGNDIVTRETCSLSECKQFRKSSCAAFCLCPLLQLGPCQIQPAGY
jgi:hypothetical protein